ncbi:MAG: hypothetical protein OHK0029_17600 [Armatimonadaceae bacterium]
MTQQPARHLAFVVPWCEKGKWLWEYLPHGIAGDVLSAAPETNDGRRYLPPYLGEAVHLLRRRADWNRYEVVFAWELRCALAVSLCRYRGRHGQPPPRFVVVGPILKGPIRRVLPLIRWALRDADPIVCFSSAECEENSRLLRMPRERFVFLPTPWQGERELPEPVRGEEQFILALGQSNRDYKTLIRAVRETDLPVVIVAGNRSVLGGEPIPLNVTVRFNTNSVETDRLIVASTLNCIPLHPANFSAGQSVLLRTMAQGKAVVVSDTPGVRDYVQKDKTAVLVPPGDAEALRRELLHLWHDPAERKRLGCHAAQTVREEFGFARFTERLLRVAQVLLSG